MALIKCLDCGKEVSDKAGSCPNCGCPVSYGIGNNKEKIETPNDSQVIIKKAPASGSFIGFIIISFIILFVIYLVLKGLNSNQQATDYQSRQAIEIVKNAVIFTDTPPIGDLVEARANNDKNIYKVYGWEAEKVDDDTYFVYFAFDYDNNRDNGFYMYSYEVNIQSEVVREVTGNDTLEKKYQDLGFIE